MRISDLEFRRVLFRSEQLGVEAETHFRHLPALVLAEQFAGAADFQVVGGQGEAGAELVHRGDRVQPLARVRTDRTLVRDQDRKSVVWGKSVSVRVVLGGRRLIKKQNEKRK